MDIYTMQLNHAAPILTTNDIPILDVSPLVGNTHFSPTGELAAALSAKAITPMTFTDMFYEQMRQSFDRDPHYWLSLLSDNPKMVVGCACSLGTVCHRHFLPDIFAKISLFYRMPFRHCGELTDGAHHHG